MTAYTSSSSLFNLFPAAPSPIVLITHFSVFPISQAIAASESLIGFVTELNLFHYLHLLQPVKGTYPEALKYAVF